MISKLLLSTILLGAGVLHILKPEIFDPAIPFSYKLEINYISGLIEILLGLGLLMKKTQDLSARLTALWFLFLLPVHMYMAINVVPIFGAKSATIHWVRTLFQFVLYYWALSLQTKGWIISQRWKHVLFMHYEVDASNLQKLVPYPIDLFEGKAVVSIVPFEMSRIRFPFLPALLGFSKLNELNLRTYVRVNNRPAVYFFTLDTNHLPAVLVARSAFSLPYRFRSMNLIVDDKTYQFESKSLTFKAHLSDDCDKNDFSTWATERYALFTKRWGRDIVGVVEHIPWSLRQVELQTIEDKFSSDFLNLKNFVGASYAASLDVRFRPFTQLT